MNTRSTLIKLKTKQNKTPKYETTLNSRFLELAAYAHQQTGGISFHGLLSSLFSQLPMVRTSMFVLLGQQKKFFFHPRKLGLMAMCLPCGCPALKCSFVPWKASPLLGSDHRAFPSVHCGFLFNLKKREGWLTSSPGNIVFRF